jgi:hypothetical protein
VGEIKCGLYPKVVFDYRRSLAQVRLYTFHSVVFPYRARNITLGLGENKIMIYIVDSTSQDLEILSTISVSIYRKNRGLVSSTVNNGHLKTCTLKQVKPTLLVVFENIPIYIMSDTVVSFNFASKNFRTKPVNNEFAGHEFAQQYVPIKKHC